MTKRDFTRSAGNSLCPRASDDNKKQYEEAEIARIGKAAFYRNKRKHKSNDRILLDREYRRMKQVTKLKTERLQLIKELAELWLNDSRYSGLNIR